MRVIWLLLFTWALLHESLVSVNADESQLNEKAIESEDSASLETEDKTITDDSDEKQDDEDGNENGDEERNAIPVAEEDKDSHVSACYKYGPCVCYKKKLDCDDAEVDYDSDEEGFIEQPSKLDSANLVLPANFKPYYVSFRRNAIKQLRKGELVKQARISVSHLRLSDNRIVYIEPGTFQEFENLTRLDLSNNQLKALNSEMFKGLDKLELLDLSGNGITMIPRNVFMNLKGLKTLILDDNKLRKLEHDSFDGLSSLKKFSVDNCDLGDDSVDDMAFESFEKTLEELSLVGNPMTIAPRPIIYLKKLKALDMSATNIVEVNKDTFSNSLTLETILLSRMPYLWLIDECAFCKFKSLKTIDFYNSTHLYSIDENAFGNVDSKAGKPENLTEVNFEYCNFTTFPEDLVEWNNTKLRVNGNPLVCHESLQYLLGDEAFEQRCPVEKRVQRCPYWLPVIAFVVLSLVVCLVSMIRLLFPRIRRVIRDIPSTLVDVDDKQKLAKDFEPLTDKCPMGDTLRDVA